jgi:autotransporter-associated beta strand protein
MKSIESYLRWTAASVLTCAFALAAEIQKADNTEALHQGNSWEGGVAPGPDDTALWSDAVSGANATVLGYDLAWSGITVRASGGPVTIGAGNTLTNGSGGIDLSQAAQDLTLACDLYLNGAQTLSVTNGKTLTVSGRVASSGEAIGLSVKGDGTVRWSGTAPENTGLGYVTFGSPARMVVDGGLLSVYQGGGWDNTLLAVTNNGHFRIVRSSGSAEYNVKINNTIDISSGVFEDLGSGTFYFGRYNGIGTPCRMTVRGSGSLSVPNRQFVIGFSGANNRLTLQDSGTASFGQDLCVGNGSTNFVDVYGGTLTVAKIFYLGYTVAGRANDNRGCLTVTNGRVVAAGGLTVMTTAGKTGIGTVALSGGQLLLGSAGITTGTVGTCSMNITLSGGTVGALADWSSPLPMTLTNDTGDVTFHAADTNGAPRAISLSGTLSGIGGFIKTGDGVLTLAGMNTFAGAAAVSNGTLRLTRPMALPAGTDVTLAPSAVMALDFEGTNTVRSLRIGTVQFSRGVYSAARLPGRLTGTGFLQTTDPAPPGTLISVQ